jgi:Zn-dependent protease/predicted transcriptional regulator
VKWSFSIGRIAGIECRVHVTFLLFVAWIAIEQGVQRGDPVHALGTLVLLLLVFACVLLHELGHALAARRYGIGTKDIVLLPFGGVARLERMPEKPAQEMVVALAGPAVNVMLAALLAAFGATSFVGKPLGDAFGGTLLAVLFSVNVMMVLFNLIPAFPMDGGRVLRAALAFAMPFARATRVAAFVGQGIALLFGAYGLFAGQPMLLFVALFVFLAAGEERAMVETRDTLAGLPVREAMLTDFRMVNLDDPLDRAVEHLMSGSQQDFPVMDGAVPVGVLTRANLVVALRRGGEHQRVADVMQPLDRPVEASEPLEGALRRMRAAGQSTLPVLDGGRMIGLLTLENIGELLLVRDALSRHSRHA